MHENRIYVCIDLKSFYASVECKERELDPMTTNLVVADPERTDKTICLAVSPAMKALGVPGRCRVFEIPKGIEYIKAPPRMKLYIDYSAEIYAIYLKYIAKEDIHVYSIDEVFMDVTDYLSMYQMSAKELGMKIMQDIYETTGIISTCGIGTNLYHAKIALDITAKHVEVHIGDLDEESYRRTLWNHRPLTDFWRVGAGYARKLQANGLYTMGDIARCSLGKANDYYNEDLLYRLFGINAELLVDHAWGWEPVTIADIKGYKPQKHSLGSGQVLHCAYPAEKAKLIVKEMTDLLVLDLVDKKLVTDQMVLTIGYDIDNLTNPDRRKKYHGEVTTDQYGRRVPKHAHGTVNLPCQTSSTKIIMDAVTGLFDQIINWDLLVRRVNIVASRVVPESEVKENADYEQLDLFTDYKALEQEREAEKREREKEKKMQHAILDIQKKYGKNAVLKGMNFEEGATTRERNRQIGGHKA